VVEQCPIEALTHIRIKGGHHLGAALDHGDVQAAQMQGFGHLQTEIAAADDDRRSRLLLGKRPFELRTVDEVVDIVDIAAGDALERRSDRCRPGGEEQLIVVLPAFGRGGQIPRQNPLVFRIDDRDLVPDLDVDIVLFTECFRRSGDKRLFPVDQTGDIVGDASGRKRGVRSAFKNRDVGRRLQPANQRCGGHSRGIAADDDEHVVPSLPEFWRFKNRSAGTDAQAPVPPPFFWRQSLLQNELLQVLSFRPKGEISWS
jgi:hypothetical protein